MSHEPGFYYIRWVKPPQDEWDIVYCSGDNWLAVGMGARIDEKEILIIKFPRIKLPDEVM